MMKVIPEEMRQESTTVDKQSEPPNGSAQAAENNHI